MRSFFLPFVFLLISVGCWANRVDSIKTNADALAFINSLLDKKYRGQATFPELNKLPIDKRILEMASPQNWYKADINCDGLTDLLANFAVDGIERYVFIDDAKGSFKISRLKYSLFVYREWATIANVKGQPVVLFYTVKNAYANNRTYQASDSVSVDTLTYKFDRMVEYDPKPTPKKIARLTFRTGPCFGECPIFSITLNVDGAATYSGGKYNEDKGEYKGEIKKEDLKPFLDIVDYLDIAKLKNEYTTSWTDDATYWLTVRFADGTSKEIKDYAGLGTFGLRALYSKFFKLKKDQIWYEQ